MGGDEVVVDQGVAGCGRKRRRRGGGRKRDKEKECVSEREGKKTAVMGERRQRAKSA
jgi:hypothetical protein